MAEVDDAEPVAVRVGEHDEIRVVRIAVPVDPLRTYRHETIHLGGPLGSIRPVHRRLFAQRLNYRAAKPIRELLIEMQEGVR
jgi:hypothetical protein